MCLGCRLGRRYGGFRKQLTSKYSAVGIVRTVLARMAQTGLSAIAASLNRERGLSRGVLGGMAGCVRQPLGVRVPCGQQHAMGINVPDAMARASVYGIRKIKYCAQVRH